MGDAEINEITASEALFGFIGWLTTRDEPVVFSACHDGAVAASLVSEYCEKNKLTPPRENFGNFLISMYS